MQTCLGTFFVFIKSGTPQVNNDSEQSQTVTTEALMESSSCMTSLIMRALTIYRIGTIK